jgi:hypothetical protein
MYCPREKKCGAAQIVPSEEECYTWCTVPSKRNAVHDVLFQGKRSFVNDALFQARGMLYMVYCSRQLGYRTVMQCPSTKKFCTWSTVSSR